MGAKYGNEPEYFAAERVAKSSRTGFWSQPDTILLRSSVTLKEPMKPHQTPV
jgi:endonuclease YncB( thermonuclease family)